MSKMQEAHPGLTNERALTWATAAYNDTPTITGFSPNQLVFGVRNVQCPVTEMSVAECEETETSRYLNDFQLRAEAIANHNEIRNSRKWFWLGPDPPRTRRRSASGCGSRGTASGRDLVRWLTP